MIIGLSAKKQSGKDEVCKIIQRLTAHSSEVTYFNTWENKKFAEKLKQIVALLLGVDRSLLEDEDFKNRILPPVWDKWEITSQFDTTYYTTYKEAEESHGGYYTPKLVRMTPRKLLQVIGTDCMRDMIHPEIWVNSLMSDYKPFEKPKAHDLKSWSEVYRHPSCLECKQPFFGYKRQWMCKDCIENAPDKYPNWIITDCRFPNEAKAIKDREGILIRIERPWFYRFLEDTEDGKHEFSDKEDRTGKVYRFNAGRYSKEEAEAAYKKDMRQNEPISEYALDNYQNWDYTIINDGTLDELEQKLIIILEKEGILTKD
jgi:hypothetical protein